MLRPGEGATTIQDRADLPNPTLTEGVRGSRPGEPKTSGVAGRRFTRTRIRVFTLSSRCYLVTFVSDGCVWRPQRSGRTYLSMMISKMIL